MFLSFPKLSPGIVLPTRSLPFQALYPEGFTWMKDNLNVSTDVSKLFPSAVMLRRPLFRVRAWGQMVGKGQRVRWEDNVGEDNVGEEF